MSVRPLAPSALLAAWQRRAAALAAGNPHADVEWYDFLRGMFHGRQPHPVRCEDCEDRGILEVACTIAHRCRSYYCEPPAKRSDPDYTHTYAVPCHCTAGDRYRRSLGYVDPRDRASAPPEAEATPRRTRYGATGTPRESRRVGGWRSAV